jgi:hypothetical protein
MAKSLGDELKKAGMQSPERAPDPLHPEALQVFLAAFSRGRSPGTLSEHAARNIQRCYADDPRAVVQMILAGKMKRGKLRSSGPEASTTSV